MKNKKDENEKINKRSMDESNGKLSRQKEEIEFNQFCDENKINENDRLGFLNNLHNQGKFLSVMFHIAESVF